jgi:hypothetical protein
MHSRWWLKWSRWPCWWRSMERSGGASRRVHASVNEVLSPPHGHAYRPCLYLPNSDLEPPSKMSVRQYHKGPNKTKPGVQRPLSARMTSRNRGKPSKMSCMRSECSYWFEPGSMAIYLSASPIMSTSNDHRCSQRRSFSVNSAFVSVWFLACFTLRPRPCPCVDGLLH